MDWKLEEAAGSRRVSVDEDLEGEGEEEEEEEEEDDDERRPVKVSQNDMVIRS